MVKGAFEFLASAASATPQFCPEVKGMALEHIELACVAAIGDECSPAELDRAYTAMRGLCAPRDLEPADRRR
jgi:hypothetical protein